MDGTAIAGGETRKKTQYISRNAELTIRDGSAIPEPEPTRQRPDW
jgi:hypothetical protein